MEAGDAGSIPVEGTIQFPVTLMRSALLTATVEYYSLTELTLDEQELVLAAREATSVSHSPYSKFLVGSAVRLKDGTIVKGANQENASYGLAVCSERTTIFSIKNMGKKRDIRKLAVTGRIGTVSEAEYKGSAPLTPCGACRQVIREAEDLAGLPIVILMDGYGPEVARVVGISALLPLGFGPADFGANMDEL